MRELIQNYYLSEINTSYLGIAIGLVFIIAGIICWKAFGMNQIFNGLKYVILIGGVFYLIPSAIYSINTHSKLQDIKQTTITENELQQTEIARMQKVIPSSYTGSFVFATLMLVAGIVLLIVLHKDFIKGIAIGLIIIGITINTLEYISLQKNINHQNKIEAYIIK
jgi:hypothetical protein